jgi:hypothetical protein
MAFVCQSAQHFQAIQDCRNGSDGMPEGEERFEKTSPFRDAIASYGYRGSRGRHIEAFVANHFPAQVGINLTPLGKMSPANASLLRQHHVRSGAC